MERSNPDVSMISILYVEDEQEAREILGSILVRKYPDILILFAENGKMGLKLFKQHQPDIVITDISMPLLDGVKMAAKIKSLNPETAIIAVTAYSDTKYLLNAIEIGINHYVLKPVDYRRFFSIIDKSIATIMMEKKVRAQSNHIRKLSSAVEQSPNTVVITDANANIEYVNPKFTELTGYTNEEALGQNPRILKSGSMASELYEDLWNTISSGKVWNGEFLNMKKNGELYWESASISPIHNDEGVITHYVAVKEDITARKQAELDIEALNISLATRAQELETANKELETFSYTVSHDLRSPITTIHGFSQVLLEKCEGQIDKSSMKCIHVIHQEVLRMEAMIKSLLNFSKLSRQELDQEEVDLATIASTLAMELQMCYPSRQVSFSIDKEARCYGDPVLLRVVMGNLLENAWKYTSKTESATIEFGVMNSGKKPIFFVRDNGAGFDKKQTGKLFGVFQRLHTDCDFEGFGIGLATVQRIIQRHGGIIYAEGDIDKGATFYFTLGEKITC
jgi:PAS domain S-box-containing protein